MLLSLAIFLLATAGYFRLRHFAIAPKNRQYTDYAFGLAALIFTISTDTLTTVLSVALVYYLYRHYQCARTPVVKKEEPAPATDSQ